MSSKIKLFWQTFKDCRMQWFDDRKHWPKEDKKGIIKPGHCQFKDILKDAKMWKDRNAKGWGIFIQPNPLKEGATTRTEKDVESIEWVYADIDGKPKEWQMERIKASPIPPDIVTESKASYHLYWKCHCSNREQFDKIIKGLRVFFESDIAVSSVNEVLRLPGFLHNKYMGEPFLIRVEHIDIVGTTPEEMIDKFQYTKTDKKTISSDADNTEIQMIKDIPIRTVLDSLGVRYNNQGFILDGDEVTSAHINENYITRFSGKDGSGSTIDAVMAWGGKNLKDAIEYLKKLGNIDSEVVVKKIIKNSKSSSILDRYKIPAPKNYKTWGVKKLDNIFKKPRKSDYILFLGEAGKGKTTFCLHMAVQNAMRGVRVLFLSLEMTKEQVQDRYIDVWAQISDLDREKAVYGPTQQKRMKEAAEDLEQENLIMLDMADIKNSHDFGELVRFMNGFDLIFIDNFSRITLRGGAQSEVEMQSITSEMIDKYVGQTGATVVMLHHYSKPTGRKRGLEARGSQKLIDDCTIHASITTDEEDMSIVKFSIVKSRYNKSGEASIKFNRGKYESDWKTDALDQFKKTFNV